MKISRAEELTRLISVTILVCFCVLLIINNYITSGDEINSIKYETGSKQFNNTRINR